MTVAAKVIIIGSRGSALALWQARHIQASLTQLGADARIEVIKTTGDKITDVPLAQVGGKGLFTKEIEEALLDRSIDLAVHGRDAAPKPPVEAYLRVIDEPVLRLVSVDLGAHAGAKVSGRVRVARRAAGHGRGGTIRIRHPVSRLITAPSPAAAAPLAQTYTSCGSCKSLHCRTRLPSRPAKAFLRLWMQANQL